MPRDGKYPCFAGHFTEGGDFYLSKSGFLQVVECFLLIEVASETSDEIYSALLAVSCFLITPQGMTKT